MMTTTTEKIDLQHLIFNPETFDIYSDGLIQSIMIFIIWLVGRRNKREEVGGLGTENSSNSRKKFQMTTKIR